MLSEMLPVVNLDAYLSDPTSPLARAEATKTAEALIKYGALLVKDSRVTEDANDRFLDLLEDYFDQPTELLEPDCRPEFYYQVGTTLENVERAKCHSSVDCQAIIAALDPKERPLSTSVADPKCRFFHRMGVSPPSTSFPTLSMPNVTPAAFAGRWESGMQAWGGQIKEAVEGVVEMLSVGLGVGQGALADAGKYGPHLLAPTATDLRKYGKLNEIFAGFHTDLNALTIHGRSRYPGLHIWARNTGKRLCVKVPSGHLLVQASKQLEHLTNGLILAGYHEVVCTAATLETMKERLVDPRTCARPPIRISSTFFWHLSSDYELRPREFVDRMRAGGFDATVLNTLAAGDYEEGMKVGTLVQNELRSIELM